MLNRLTEEMKKAMKSKESFRLTVIRMLISELKNEDKVVGKKRNTDEILLAYNKKLVKALEEFPEDKREPLRQEIKIVEEFLPKMMTVEEIKDFIKNNVAEVNLKNVMPLLKGKADSLTVKNIVDSWQN